MRELWNEVVCKDGVHLSVQAGKSHYCSPRSDTGPYHAVEVGFIQDKQDQPFTPPETWREYGDGGFPSDVYGYIPVQLVREFIDAHGGPETGRYGAATPYEA